MFPQTTLLAERVIMSKKNVSIHIRCDEDLANEFKRACEEKGYSQSLVMRELMKDYLKKNKQPDLLK